jgi:hypothetical protein
MSPHLQVRHAQASEQEDNVDQQDEDENEVGNIEVKESSSNLPIVSFRISEGSTQLILAPFVESTWGKTREDERDDDHG